MKTKLKQVLTGFTLFFTLITFSQVTVTTEAMAYESGSNSGTFIDECGTIDLGSDENTTVSFWVKLTKNSTQVVGDGNLYVYTKHSVNDPSENELFWESVPSSFWTNNNTEYIKFIPPVTLQAQTFDTTGGVLFVKYVSSGNVPYFSCNYSIIKDELPSFSINPSSTTVSCGSTATKTFTVNEENIPSGSTLTYNWQVGSGWNNSSGNPVSNFTTTTNSVQLTPYSYPPSDVKVTPVLNGDSYPQLTSTINLSNFNPSYQISGSSYVCDIGIYTVDNSSSSTSIQSVNSSDTNIATASLDMNGEITVTKVSNGTITLSVVLQNACSQTATITKNMQIGVVETFINATLTGNDFICDTQYYTYSLSGINNPCATINWYVSPNLIIISENSNSITVTRNLSNTEFAGFILANIASTDIEVSKGVWVGMPDSLGLSIQLLGAYDLYTGRWSKLKAQYIPLMYEINDPLILTYEWQIPSSTIRNYADTAYKDVKPYNSGQLNIGIRASCECGNSEWRYRTFDVINSNNGNGGTIELIPAD